MLYSAMRYVAGRRRAQPAAFGWPAAGGPGLRHRQPGRVRAGRGGRAGLVGRDVAANMLLGGVADTGRAVHHLSDFGISKEAGTVTADLTLTGQVLGTLAPPRSRSRAARWTGAATPRAGLHRVRAPVRARRRSAGTRTLPATWSRLNAAPPSSPASGPTCRRRGPGAGARAHPYPPPSASAAASAQRGPRPGLCAGLDGAARRAAGSRRRGPRGLPATAADLVPSPPPPRGAAQRPADAGPPATTPRRAPRPRRLAATRRAAASGGRDSGGSPRESSAGGRPTGLALHAGGGGLGVAVLAVGGGAYAVLHESALRNGTPAAAGSKGPGGPSPARARPPRPAR